MTIPLDDFGRVPHDPENFRITYRRTRHYIDPLPTCPVAGATEAKFEGLTNVIKRAWPATYKARHTFDDGTADVYALDSVRHLQWIKEAGHLLPPMGDEFARAFLSSADLALKAASNRGKQAHDVFECMILGRPVNPGPLAVPYVDAIAAAVAELERRYGLASALTERAVYLREAEIGGTFDLWLSGVIVDLKTRGAGKEVDAEEGEVAQVGGYSMADYYIDTVGGEARRVKMPDVEAGAIVVVSPSEVAVVEVDIDKARAAWSALVECDGVRLSGQQAARKAKAKRVATIDVAPASPHPSGEAEPAPEGASTACTAMLSAEGSAPGQLETALARMAGLDEPQVALLRKRWPFPVPAKRLAPEDAPRLVALLDDIARDTGAPFTPTEAPATTPPPPRVLAERPTPPAWQRPDEGPALDEATTKSMQDAGKRLPADAKAWVKARMSEARSAGRPVLGDVPTQRWLEIGRALMNAALAYHDALDRDPDLVRSLVAAATGIAEAEQPGITLGMVFGSLTIAEAVAVSDLMEHVCEGTKRLGFDADGRPVAVAA